MCVYTSLWLEEGLIQAWFYHPLLASLWLSPSQSGLPPSRNFLRLVLLHSMPICTLPRRCPVPSESCCCFFAGSDEQNVNMIENQQHCHLSPIVSSQTWFKKKKKKSIEKRRESVDQFNLGYAHIYIFLLSFFKKAKWNHILEYSARNSEHEDSMFQGKTSIIFETC